jgi:hypothetical protein
MIACALRSGKLEMMPQRLCIIVGWCSDGALAEFTNAAAYIHAFGLALNLIPEM